MKFAQENYGKNNIYSLIHLPQITHERMIVSNKIWNKLQRSPKSAKSYRTIPIPDKIWYRVQRICEGKKPNDFIFGDQLKPLDPCRLQYQFTQYLRRHKIKIFNFHQLRHKFATCCLEQKMDIKVLSELLGHSSVSITLNYYIHPETDYKRRQINKFANAY